MIDEAFLTLQQLIRQMLDFAGDMEDQDSGVRSSIYEFTIDTPIELSVGWNETGELQIGSTPPLYDVNTTFLPSFHQIKFTAQRLNMEQSGENDGD
jgi:hypothetical protein